MSTARTPASVDGIAIIGMSGRFPGAHNLDLFWRNLSDGVESITFLTDQELEALNVNPMRSSAPNFVKAMPVLDDVELFDATFFGYTPFEAEVIDPQQRLFLECAWEALEQAAYDPETYQGWVGVYAGLNGSGYLLSNILKNSDVMAVAETGNTLYLTTGNSSDYLATRVSYKLNLKGPSVVVQTACSTSLVATHLACQGLLNYQCDMALAGGVAIQFSKGYHYHEGGLLSPDGHCRTFDAQAQGTVFGSGVGVVVLKRLVDALADGDYIHAVIKGSAINNDGSAKVGFTAPSVEGQTAVILMAQGIAGVPPETISYVEAHGTATPVGDPIEVAALTRVFRTGTQKKGFCAIGSVKTNIGHTDTAAGIAGLIKTVLALKHKQIPPSLHFHSPNPKIDFANSPFYVNTKLSEWKAGPTPRRAGVNSFGVGGTNAHVVLEEAPFVEMSGPSRSRQMLVLSAKTDSALETMTDNLVAYLKLHPDLNVADLAYTLQVGRRIFNHRRMLVCCDLDDAALALESRDPKRVVTLPRGQRNRPVVFLFPGQGAQYVAMARDLYQTEPLFREQVDRCAAILEAYLGLDIRDLLYPAETMNDERGTMKESMPDSHRSSFIVHHSEALDQTQYAQPALFVIEYALAQLWMSWGVRPQAMVGHSIGEYVAACLAGVFSLADALMLVAARGRLMQELPAGTMLAVSLPEHQVQPLLGDQLSLAAINGPSRCVVAGPTNAMAALERDLAEQGIDCRRLHTSHAFHSSMMDPILEPFRKQIQRVRLRTPSVPYLSNLTGTWITDEDVLDPGYWARHLRQTVRFADALHELLQEPDRILLEVGPGQMLSALARQHPARVAGQTVLSSLRHPQDQQSDVAVVLHTLGQLWLADVPIDWSGFYAHERRQRLPLPTYPFERQRYWITPTIQEDNARAQPGALRKKPDIADWFYIPSWKRSAPPVQESNGLMNQTSGWIVFIDELEFGAPLVKWLEHADQDVVTVTAGDQFRRCDERAYVLNPRRPEDYDSLLDAVCARHAFRGTIVYLWSLTPNDERYRADERFERALDLSFYGLLFLAQALGRQATTEPVHIAIISNGMQKVAREAVLCPENATLLGPCKVIPQEYPNITCQSIDIVFPQPGTPEHAELLDQISAELAAHSTDRIIAYRDYDRWVQTFEAVRLGEAIEEKTQLREAGVYLITGGLGGIGLVLATYLAQAARAKLILTGRSAFPEPETWDQWLATHGDQDSLSAKIQKLRELEALGAQVLVVSADVADERQMRAAVARASERFGAIHGVIHAAGIAGGGLIQLKTPETAARVLAPKVTALRVLETVLADIQLDFLVLCSSITSIIGGVGQVDYCAANAFLDAYAYYCSSKRRTATVSINWDAWQEVGMAVDTAVSYGLQESSSAIVYTEIGHPLLGKRIRATSGQEIYLTEFHGPNHWILAEHKIMEVPTIPGTAYLEMARAAFENRAKNRPIEIREVFFLNPLMVAADEHKEVHTILDGYGDVVTFRVVSRSAPKRGEEPARQEHVRGKIAQVDADPPKQYHLQELIEKCSQRGITVTEAAIKKVQADFNRVESFIYWGPRWMSLQKAYIGDGEGLAILELPEEFAADLAKFGLHPALLDMATSFGIGLTEIDSGFLPLSYKRVRVYAPMSRTLYSYIRYKEDPQAEKKTISFDITIMDEHGQVLVEIEDFTMRRVDDSIARLRVSASRESNVEDQSALSDAEQPDDQSNRATSAPLATPGKAGFAVTGLLSSEGVDAFKRLLSRNKLPQIAVSTKDLNVLIERANTINQSSIGVVIDQAQPQRPMYPRPNVQTAYVAPRNEIEQRLADIWQRVLGVEHVGIHDSFFELGGDSVLALHLIARSNDAGIQLSPPQLFQRPTIAELAVMIDPSQVVTAGPESGDDTSPLAPIQMRFFEQGSSAPYDYSRALLLELPSLLDAGLLERAVQHLLGHHDALRLRFIQDTDGWRQRIDGREEHPVFVRLDQADVPEAARAAAIRSYVTEVRTTFDLATGPLLHVALLDYGADQAAHLLLVIHHLIADQVSCGILLEDLWTAYGQLARGEAVALAPKTTAFKQWVERLVTHARSDAVRRELPYWLAVLGAPVAPLPLDEPVDAEANIEAPVDRLTTELSASETRVLLEEALHPYQTEVEDMVLTALVEAFAQWTGDRTLLVDLEVHGHASIFEDMDLSRTVGCCAAVFPVRLDLSAAHDPGDALKTIKELRRAAPQRGLGYGLLRYLGDPETSAQLRSLRQPQICFSYQGRADQMPSAAMPFRPIREPMAPEASPRNHRPYLLEVNASIVEGQFRLEWIYSRQIHSQTTVERLAHDCITALQDIIAHCRSREGVSFTPSDFPEAGLSQEELDSLLTDIRRLAR